MKIQRTEGKIRHFLTKNNEHKIITIYNEQRNPKTGKPDI